MTARFYATDKQIEAVAYELAERFFKRVAAVKTMQDQDDLATALATAISDWQEKSAVRLTNETRG